ncbi:sialidase family protein [Aeoliella sp.]|uniref:sialidase family protein n=1 Tax=Aeoliella sp. TaxID=2795800 RepID=UPI003CCBC633
MPIVNRCFRIIISVTVCCFLAASPARAEDFPNVPGTVIHHSPASSGLFIGSPSIARLADGTLVASHDEFGPKSNEHVSATTRVYASSDNGEHWEPIAKIQGQFWSTLFVHRGVLYLIGTDRHHGHAIIRRSDDGGATWTTPNDASTGLLAEGQYHCAPQPVMVHQGRIWRAFEDAAGGMKWGERYRPLMISAAVDADLLDRDSWTFTNYVTLDKSHLNGKMRGWLEGNAVVDPNGNINNILRVEAGDMPGKAALMQVASDGKTIKFDPEQGYIDLPGGSKKFTIRRDPQTGRYWTLVNWVMPEYADGRRASQVRNTLALASSTDLRDWQVHRVLIHDPDLGHGFQYADWLFDGADMIAVVRTATDDGLGGPHNYHDANFLTFHRIEDYAQAVDEIAKPQ